MAPNRNKAVTAVSPPEAEARWPHKVPNLYGLVGISSPSASEAEIQMAFEAIIMKKDESLNSSVSEVLVMRLRSSYQRRFHRVPGRMAPSFLSSF